MLHHQLPKVDSEPMPHMDSVGFSPSFPPKFGGDWNKTPPNWQFDTQIWYPVHFFFRNHASKLHQILQDSSTKQLPSPKNSTKRLDQVVSFCGIQSLWSCQPGACTQMGQPQSSYRLALIRWPINKIVACTTAQSIFMQKLRLKDTTPQTTAAIHSCEKWLCLSHTLLRLLAISTNICLHKGCGYKLIQNLRFHHLHLSCSVYTL